MLKVITGENNTAAYVRYCMKLFLGLY